MFAVNDTLAAVMLGAFLFGLVFSALSLLLGDLSVNLHLQAHGDHPDIAGVPVNASTILAFIGWFGGVGYLAHQAAGWPALASLLAGMVGGLIGAAVIAAFLIKVIRADDPSLNPEDFRLPGTIARVASTIRAGGTGEIIYEQAGVRQVSAARTRDGRPIPKGEEVVVLTTSHGIAMVEPAAVFFGEETAIDRAATTPAERTHLISDRSAQISQ